VETLVASAIIAAMLGVTYQAIQASARQSRMVEDRRLATLVAQTQMAAIGASVTGNFGETRGTTSGISWRIVAEPYRTAEAPSGRIKLDLISVSAGMGNRDLVTLRTLRLSR
jgi:hypothetical protein